MYKACDTGYGNTKEGDIDMRKKAVLVTLAALLMTGCSASGVSQEQYESVVAEYESVVAERDALKEELDSLSTEDTAAESEETDQNGSNNKPQLSSSDLLEQVSIKEYSFTDSIDTAWYFMEITNNSPVTIRVETNVIAKDADGNTIGAFSGSEDAIESGYTVCIPHMFDEGKPESYEYTLSVNEEDYYKPVLSDLEYEISDTGNKLIITCTNKGEEAAEFVEGLVLFFQGDRLLGQSSDYFTDNDSELKPGDAIASEFDSYSDEQYDNYKFYLTGTR